MQRGVAQTKPPVTKKKASAPCPRNAPALVPCLLVILRFSRKIHSGRRPLAAMDTPVIRAYARLPRGRDYYGRYRLSPCLRYGSFKEWLVWPLKAARTGQKPEHDGRARGGFPGTRVKGKNPPGGLAPYTPAPRAAGGGRRPMASFTPCGVPARLGKNDRQGLLPPAYYRRTMRRVLFWGLGD